tara:strand:- start:51 stop:401 length:351 start_codon:yes stop_codon:yes gene_type:complete
MPSKLGFGNDRKKAPGKLKYGSATHYKSPVPMIEGAAGAMGMISGMMNKKKEDSPTDYKTPAKYEKDPKKFEKRKEEEKKPKTGMTVTRTNLKTGETSDPKKVKTKNITKDEFFSG